MIVYIMVHMISYGKGFGEKGAYLFAKVLIYCLKQSHQLPGDQPQHKRQMWYKQREEGKQGIQSHLSKLEALEEKKESQKSQGNIHSNEKWKYETLFGLRSCSFALLAYLILLLCKKQDWEIWNIGQKWGRAVRVWEAAAGIICIQIALFAHFP